jgi:hypothetical protein
MVNNVIYITRKPNLVLQLVKKFNTIEEMKKKI